MQGTKNAIVIALSIVAIAMALYQLLYTQILIQSPDGHVITHLGFALVVVFLSRLRSEMGKKRKALIWVLLLLSLVVTGYLMIELDEILEYRTSIPATSDLVIGTLVIIILLVGNWMIFGKTFTIVSLVAVAYLVIGRYLPAPFTVPAISYVRLLMWLSVELGSGKGVYGYGRIGGSVTTHIQSTWNGSTAISWTCLPPTCSCLFFSAACCLPLEGPGLLSDLVAGWVQSSDQDRLWWPYSAVLF